MHDDNKFDKMGTIDPNNHNIRTFDASIQKVFKGVDNVVVGGVRLVAAVGCPPRSSVELSLVWPGRVWFGPGSGRSGTIERFRDSAKVFLATLIAL